MKIKHYISLVALLMATASVSAQKISTFETQDYDSLKVYDAWKASPFNTNQLQGNIAVIPNTLKSPGDSSENILAIQCSRYASHMFGAKIRIKQAFELTTTTKYVHAVIKKPVEGRAMLIGLGKRTDRPGQSDQVIQFYATSISKITPNEWCDAVFPINGNGGIMITSLVIVPQSESPHDLTTDFMAYIDDVEINDSPIARYRVGDYFTNTEPLAALSRTDRHLDAVKFTGNQGGKLSATAPTTGARYVYRQMTDSVGLAVPGETLTPTITYTGSWMHGYLYMDFMNDGKFEQTLNANGTPATGSDIVAYSYYSGKNSKGTALSNANPGVNPPTFTIPANTVPGVYRLRYKVDWDNIDAGGNISSNNSIIGNGGGMIDVLINVHKTTSHVKVATRNGDVLRADNSVFAETDLPFGQAITIVLKPEAGFKQNGVIVKHGYLASEQFVHGNRQWKLDTIPANKFVNNTYTIPAKMIDGDIEIVAEFAELVSSTPKVSINANLSVKSTKQQLYLETIKPANVTICDVNGKNIFSGMISDSRNFKLQSGVYLVNKQKVIVP